MQDTIYILLPLQRPSICGTLSEDVGKQAMSGRTGKAQHMITVVKRNPAGEEVTRYAGEVNERTDHGVVIEARWTRAAKELGYTRFEPEDYFVEYYYTDRWYNIFAISGRDGKRKGWYCNVAEPAVISNDTIEQVDLYLDVWVDPAGKPLVLDEDEFEADMTLSYEQRNKAQQGLRDLLTMIAQREDIFSDAVGRGG